jgi:hypothetical protein
MVKGVNKTVIEISNTGNKLFNRVILFVSPEYVDKSDKKLTEEAQSLIKRLESMGSESLREAVKKKRKRTILIYSVLGFIVIAAAVLLTVL